MCVAVMYIYACAAVVILPVLCRCVAAGVALRTLWLQCHTHMCCMMLLCFEFGYTRVCVHCTQCLCGLLLVLHMRVLCVLLCVRFDFGYTRVCAVVVRMYMLLWVSHTRACCVACALLLCVSASARVAFCVFSLCLPARVVFCTCDLFCGRTRALCCVCSLSFICVTCMCCGACVLFQSWVGTLVL